MNYASYIFIRKKNESIEGIYCRCYGNLEHNGFILNYYYAEVKKIKKLINLGNINLLGQKVEPDELIAHNFKYEERQENVTLAYCRDGNFKKNKYSFENRSKFLEFLKRKNKVNDIYLYDEKLKKWFYLNKRINLEFVLLIDVLKNRNLIIKVDNELDILVKKYIDLEKKIDLKNFNDTYESYNDAYYEIYFLFSGKDGLLGMIDVLNNYMESFLEENNKDLYKLSNYLKIELIRYFDKCVRGRKKDE